MLQKLKAIVMTMLGIDAFNTKDGKVVFSDEEREKIVAEFGEDFVEKFSASLEKELADSSAKDQAESLQKTLDALKAENQKKVQALEKKMNEELAERDKKIEALTRKPEDDQEEEEMETPSGESKFRINPKARHNVMANMLIKGTMGADIMAAGDTIDVDDLKTEFDTFISQTDKPVLQKLTQKTESMMHMTTKVAITEWRASQAYISSVVQQFSHKWTPLGASAFTPITIKNRRHKINVPITPDEINDSWLSHLYDEGLTPEQMPITRYIINELILPKVEEDRELKLIASGKFEEFGTYPSTDDAGQATGKSMDGFMTQLIEMYEDKANNNVNFIALGPLSSANIVSKMETFVDSIDELYQVKKMNIFTSNSRYKQYKRAYRDEFPTTKNDDKATSDTIDFSVQVLQPLPSMSPFNHFFCTPKDTFIRLRHKNNGASKIWMQASDYDVKVFAEWWEGVGFAFEESIFAYIDALQVIDGYAKGEDADNLKLYMLEDAGVTDAIEANLAAYKVAIAAEDGGIATLAALQTIIDTVNAAV
jgi:hypothetical protein